jgi:hypothetical protein
LIEIETIFGKRRIQSTFLDWTSNTREVLDGSTIQARYVHAMDPNGEFVDGV